MRLTVSSVCLPQHDSRREERSKRGKRRCAGPIPARRAKRRGNDSNPLADGTMNSKPSRAIALAAIAVERLKCHTGNLPRSPLSRAR